MQDEDQPTELVNFGQAVSFPLLFGVALSLFGAATMVHLLLVSVRRRRTETGLLKVLGSSGARSPRRSAGKPSRWCWRPGGGRPARHRRGQGGWRLFAVNIGVVPVSVVQAVPLILLAAAVLVATTLLAILPALKRPDPAPPTSSAPSSE